MKAGETYTVQVRQFSGLSLYELNIGHPRPAVPVIISPGSATGPGPVINDHTPTLRWNRLNAAVAEYAVTIRRHPYGPENVAYRSGWRGGWPDSHTVTWDLDPETRYRWQLEVRNAAGSSLSNILYFQTGVNEFEVIATTPRADDIAAPASIVITATFSEAIQTGTLAVQVIAQEGYTPPSVRRVTVSDRTLAITLDAPLAPGVGYGVLIEQGAVRDLAGNPNPAFGWAFVTAATAAPAHPPTLSFPAHQEQSVAVAPVLKWQTVVGADGYFVQIDKEAAFTNVIFNQTARATSLQVSPALDNNSTYFWRVLATAGAAVGPWSDVRSFTTGSQQVFEKGEKVQVVHTRGIGLRLREEGNLSARVLDMMPEGTRLTILAGPVFADGHVWWKVRYGELDGWSSGRHLARAGDNLPPDVPANLRQLVFTETELPVGGTTREDIIVFQAQVLDTDGRQVKLEVELRPVGQGFRQRATHSSEFVPSGHKAEVDIARLPDGGYHWRARTVDAGGLASEWVCFGANNEGAADFTVDAYWPPTALFNHRPALIVSGEAITFDASGSRDRDGDIVSFNWDFGDGRTAVGKEMQHSFAAAGRYTVTLTVTDAQGFRSRRSVEVNVLGKGLRDEFNRIIDNSDYGLREILSTAKTTGGVADLFQKEIDKAAARAALQGTLGIVSLGVGVIPGKVDGLINAKGDEAVDAAAQLVIEELLKKGVSEVRDVLLELGIELGAALVQGRRPSEKIVPLLESQIQHHREELNRLRNEALAVLAELSPEQQASHLGALRLRNVGNIHVQNKYATQARLATTWAQMMNDDRASWTYITGKRIFNVSLAVGAVAGAKAAAGYALATTAIKAGTAAERVTDNIHGIMAGQDKDTQIYYQALQSLSEGVLKARYIYENTAAGLKDIIKAQPAVSVNGEIIGVRPVVEGRRRPLGIRSDIFTTGARAEATIKNTAPANTGPLTYYLHAVHERKVCTVDLGVLGWRVVGRTYRLPVGIRSEPIELNPGEKRTVSLEFYRNEHGGVIPTGLVMIKLVAIDDDGGVFVADFGQVYFGTTFIDEGRIIPESEAADLRVISYPIRSEVRYRSLTNDFEHTIFLSNPDENPVAVRVEQPLPTGITVISTGNGIQHQDTISWELILEAGESKYLEVVFRPQEETASVEMPGARLTMHDRINDNWVSFQASQVKREIPAVMSATIIPHEAKYDLSAPADVSTTIYWNDASVVESVYLGVYGFVPVAGYTVSDAVYGKSTLTILNSFIASLNPMKGDMLDFTINFDAGDPYTLTVMVIGTAPPTEVIIPPAPPDEQPVVYGDLNGDGRVTAADATLVLRAAAGLIDLSEQDEAADVNNDGRITADDATLVLRRAVRLIDCFSG
jgi:hypothetical protein